MVSASSECLFLVKWEINVSTASIACSHVEVLEIFNGLSFIDKQSADHDGTSIDHGVVRSTLAIEDWCIKYHTTGLFSNPSVHFLALALLYIQIVKICICNDLAHRLHRELALMISKLTELSIS